MPTIDEAVVIDEAVTSAVNSDRHIEENHKGTKKFKIFVPLWFSLQFTTSEADFFAGPTLAIDPELKDM